MTSRVQHVSEQAQPEPPLGEVLDFLRWLWAVDHGLETVSRRMQAELGITGPQRLTLRLIGRFPGIRPGRLARIMHLHPSTVSGLLARLERRGFIERRTDPTDHRRWHLGLSAAGRRLDTPTVATIESAIGSVLASMPPERVAAARDLLGAIAVALAVPSEDRVGSERP